MGFRIEERLSSFQYFLVFMRLFFCFMEYSGKRKEKTGEFLKNLD